MSVDHRAEKCQFVMKCERDEEGYIMYKIESQDIWDAYHTEVPLSQRGKGLGAILAKVQMCIT